MHEVEQGLFLDILLLGGPTTNIIEGFHRQLRKITKTKTMFSSDAIWGDAIWGQVSNCKTCISTTVPPGSLFPKRGKKLQILLTYMNLYSHKSFYYCQFRHKMLIYRYQQGRQANRFVLPCLRRGDTLARMAREKSSTGIYDAIWGQVPWLFCHS